MKVDQVHQFFKKEKKKKKFRLEMKPIKCKTIK